ncbi:MAG: YdcF family protein [Bryobacteraceae bacterium]
MIRRRGIALRFGLGLILLALAAYVTRTVWLGALGSILVENDGPAKADAIVVLGGDTWGTRIETAARLVGAGYAPVVLISGAPAAYGVSEADLAVPFIVREGYPADWFVPLRNATNSTRDECFVLLPELRRRQVRSLILVTSEYHTARAARTFRAAERALGYHFEMRVVPAPDPYFHARSWWRLREGRKTALGEWAKTIANALGM